MVPDNYLQWMSEHTALEDMPPACPASSINLLSQTLRTRPGRSLIPFLGCGSSGSKAATIIMEWDTHPSCLLPSGCLPYDASQSVKCNNYYCLSL